MSGNRCAELSVFRVFPVCLLALAALWTGCGAASASPPYGHLYGAADFDYVTGGYSGGDLELGYRFNRHYGIEGGYTYIGGVGADAYGDVNWAAIEGVSLDGMGYLPLGYRSPFALFGTVGLAYVDSVGGTFSDSGSGLFVGWGPAVRIGGGITCALGREFGLRAMGRWQETDFGRKADGRAIFTIGLTYNL